MASFGSVFRRIPVIFGRSIRRMTFKNLAASFQIASNLRAFGCFCRSYLKGRAYPQEMTGPLSSIDVSLAVNCHLIQPVTSVEKRCTTRFDRHDIEVSDVSREEVHQVLTKKVDIHIVWKQQGSSGRCSLAMVDHHEHLKCC